MGISNIIGIILMLFTSRKQPLFRIAVSLSAPSKIKNNGATGCQRCVLAKTWWNGVYHTVYCGSFSKARPEFFLLILVIYKYYRRYIWHINIIKFLCVLSNLYINILKLLGLLLKYTLNDQHYISYLIILLGKSLILLPTLPSSCQLV